MGRGQRQLKLLFRGLTLRSREPGFAAPLVFPVILLLILGAVTLASRSTNSFLAATKESDGQAARQAAESGLSRVMVALNPFGKRNDDPYVSFLLASKWQEGKGWLITQNPSATKSILQNCGLATRGLRTNNRIPTDKSTYDDLLPPPGTDPKTQPKRGVIGSTDESTVLRFKVLRYQPPPTLPPLQTWPTACADWFTTVSGGSGLITVEGSVWRNGKQVASHRLTRNLDFEGWPLVDVPDTFPSPGPPVGLRISGQGLGTSLLSSYIYQGFETDATPQLLTVSLGNLRPQCANCTPTNQFTNNFPSGDADLPTWQPWSDSPSGTAELEEDKILLIDENFAGDPRVKDRCKFTRDNTEISCEFKENIVVKPDPARSLASPYKSPVATVRVDTSRYPVNLYFAGNIGSSFTPGWDPASPPSSPPAADKGKIILEHCSENCSSTAPTFFDHTDLAQRPRWSRLRVFGSKTNASQIFSIVAKTPTSTSLHGVFLWLPAGKLVYGNPSYTWNPTDNQWDLVLEPAPKEILSAWWVEDLDLTNLDGGAGGLKFILPLYGNPEAMTAILPPRINDSNGEPDPRFPVYSALLRPRSSY